MDEYFGKLKVGNDCYIEMVSSSCSDWHSFEEGSLKVCWDKVVEDDLEACGFDMPEAVDMRSQIALDCRDSNYVAFNCKDLCSVEEDEYT